VYNTKKKNQTLFIPNNTQKIDTNMVIKTKRKKQMANNTYHITPPNIIMVEEGISTLLLGFDTSAIQKIEEVFEKNIYEADLLFYYTDEKIDETNLGWVNAIAKDANFIIVNLDNVTPLELAIAEEYLFDDDKDAKKVIEYTDVGSSNPLVLFKLNMGDLIVKSIEGLNNFIEYALEEDGD
jgi:hypothetical protein